MIGLGSIACKAHLPVMTQQPDVELILCTRQSEMLGQLMKQYRIHEGYTDYRELAAARLDAVMIHSATQSHFEIVEFFLKQGLPVFVDKPLTDSYPTCESLHNLAEQKQLPLFMGFNRRYLPLLNQHLNLSDTHDNRLLSLRWEKHRHAEPGQIRTFLFDDFIHPLDSTNLHGDLSQDSLHISIQSDQDQLGRIDVQWQRGNTLFHASMNRLFGITQEVISASYLNISYQFDSFLTGTCWQNNQTQKLQLPDWTPMLASKGFFAMTDHWLEVVKTGRQDNEYTERNINTHQMTEHLCSAVNKQLQR